MSANAASAGLPPGDPVAQAAEYVLGLLPETEFSSFEERLQADRDLQGEVTVWREYLADLALAEVAEIAPPPQLRKRLEAVLFRNESGTIWKNIWPYALGGVAAALVLWLAVTSDLLLPDGGAAPTLQARLEPTADRPGPTLTAQLDPITGRIEVVGTGSPPPAGRVFELWLIAKDAAPVSLGLLDADGRLDLTLREDALANVFGARLAVSDEPPGGSPTGAPTGVVRAAGTFTPL